jgi:selenocysteine lyase/cysteine desulfurase
LTWVHSFSGWAIDLHAIGQVCRAHDIVFVVNASQALGVRPLDVSTAPVDAVISVGFKWLCGPYGTGFCWLHPALRAQLDPPKAYWLSMLTADDLAGSVEIRLKSGLGIKAFDIFGTANFLNFVPWTASIEYLLDRGIRAIADYDQTLVSRFLDRIDRARYTVISPLDLPRRSTLIVLTHVESAETPASYEALQRANVHVAMRAGSIRVSPHVYNSVADIDVAVDVLNARQS